MACAVVLRKSGPPQTPKGFEARRNCETNPPRRKTFFQKVLSKIASRATGEWLRRSPARRPCHEQVVGQLASAQSRAERGSAQPRRLLGPHAGGHRQ